METAASGRPRAGPPERATEMGGRKRAPHLGQWSRQEGRVTPGRTRVYSRAYHPAAPQKELGLGQCGGLLQSPPGTKRLLLSKYVLTDQWTK